MSETPGSEARPYTEASAIGDILEWSRGRPEWLRDVLRRLMVGSELSDRDIDELEAICLGNDGGASPLTDVHIAPQRLAGKPVAIRDLEEGDDEDRVKAAFLPRIETRREDRALRMLCSAHVLKGASNVDWWTFAGTAMALLDGRTLETIPIMAYICQRNYRALVNEELREGLQRM